MSKFKWDDSSLVKYAIDVIRDKIIKNGERSQSGITYSHRGFKTQFHSPIDQYKEFLVDSARLDNEIPDAKKSEIVNLCIYVACDKGKLNTGFLSQEIRKKETLYLAKPKNAYTMLSQMSFLNKHKVE